MKHWFDESRWEMVNDMSEQVLKQTQTIVAKAKFYSLSVNEVIKLLIINLGFQMHVWKIIPILFTLERVVEGGNADNLIVIIIQTFMQQGV